MTLPTIVPVEYDGSTNDFLKTKSDRSGAARVYSEAVSVPSGTTTTTIVGLIPFNKGFRVDEKSIGAFSGALGTSVTVSLGVVYNDNTNNTNNATLYASALTAAAAGGELVPVASAANLGYVTTADGWVVATIGGATTGSTGAINIQCVGSYDGLGVDNSNTQNQLAMATFAQMKTWVSKRLQDPNNTAVSSDDVGDLINQAQSYWKNVRFNFNEITDTTTLLQSNPTVPLPDDWLVPSIDNCFVIEYSGIRYPLQKVSESRYNAMYLSNGIGQPWWFAKLASSGYQVYPIPDRDYTLERYYIRDYDDFVNDGDTNDFSINANILLQYTAAAYGSRDFRQDTDMFNAFWAQAMLEEDNLLATTRKDNATGRVEIHSLL